MIQSEHPAHFSVHNSYSNSREPLELFCLENFKFSKNLFNFTLLYVGWSLTSVGRAVYTVRFPFTVSSTTDTVLYSKNLNLEIFITFLDKVVFQELGD